MINRKVRKDIFAWIAIISVIPVVIIDLLGIDLSFLPDNISQNLIMVSLAGISAAILSTDYDVIVNRLSQTHDKIGEVLLLSKGRMAAMRPAQDASIWNGFEGVFFALNPPLKLIKTSNQSYEEMVRSHALRYSNENFKCAYYIFFNHGDNGRFFPNAIHNFISFTEDMKRLEPKVENKIRIIIANEAAPGFTFFLGEKRIETKKSESVVSYSIIYINERPMVLDSGFPNWSFVSTDDELNSTLRDYGSRFLDRYESQNLSQIKKIHKEQTAHP